MTTQTKTANDMPAARTFTGELEITIAAPRETVWRALVEQLDAWWSRDYCATAGPQKMTLEARAGGHLIEEGADGAAVMWFTVLAIEPGSSLDLIGHISPAYGGPATSMLRLALTSGATEAETVLRVTDALFGRLSDKIPTCAMDGWQVIFGEGLKAFVEGGTAARAG